MLKQKLVIVRSLQLAVHLNHEIGILEHVQIVQIEICGYFDFVYQSTTISIRNTEIKICSDTSFVIIPTGELQAATMLLFLIHILSLNNFVILISKWPGLRENGTN